MGQPSTRGYRTTLVTISAIMAACWLFEAVGAEEKRPRIVGDDDLQHADREGPRHHWQAPEIPLRQFGSVRERLMRAHVLMPKNVVLITLALAALSVCASDGQCTE
jgi:hypothetical protein